LGDERRHCCGEGWLEDNGERKLNSELEGDYGVKMLLEPSEDLY